MSATETDLIAAFDQVLTHVYGRRYTRENPHKSDIETASTWLAKGLDMVTAVCVFYDGMSRMHERSLHQRRGSSEERALVPHALKLFDANIETALRTCSSDFSTTYETDLARWRLRTKAWKKSKFWLEEIWGPPPGDPQSRVPISVLRDVL